MSPFIQPSSLFSRAVPGPDRRFRVSRERIILQPRRKEKEQLLRKESSGIRIADVIANSAICNLQFCPSALFCAEHPLPDACGRDMVQKDKARLL
jgi:hypothetical protein